MGMEVCQFQVESFEEFFEVCEVVVAGVCCEAEFGAGASWYCPCEEARGCVRAVV